jgi:uncharacterized protein involved in exopolysaccharide biosynthesis
MPRVLISIFSDKRKRWLVYGLAAIALGVLCIFPRPYMARAKIVPGDSGANSLISVVGALGGGQAQNLASLFGDRGAIEVTLQLSRSEAVADDVIERLELVGPGKAYASQREARLDLADRVGIHTLLGGILEVETKSRNSQFALSVTQSYVDAISDRLSEYSRVQVARKRRIVEERRASAQDRLAAAQAALDIFRRQNQLADPQAQLGGQLSLRIGIEAQIQAKLVELSALRETTGPENPRLIVAERQLITLREQLARTEVPTNSAAGPSVGDLTNITLRYTNLYRDFIFAQAIYDVYARSAEEVEVQEMMSQDRSQVAVVDPAHVDSERYFNNTAVALLALLILFVGFVEIYGPLTGLWPVGSRKPDDA